MRHWPRRVVLLVVAAVGAGGIWLIMHYVGKARTERLGEDIVLLATESAPPATIEKLTAGRILRMLRGVDGGGGRHVGQASPRVGL